MINAIKLPALRNGEFIQLMSDILAIISKNDPAALKVEEPYNKLKEIFDSIEGMFKIQRAM